MKKDILDNKNAIVGSVDLSDKVFATEVNSHNVYEAVKNILANKRQGTADTKTRGEVNGSTRKPWKQKGTGRARAGMRKSPLFTGAGIIFGPHPRDYSYVIPKKVRRQALFSVFSQSNIDNKLKVIEDFSIEKYCTKDMDKIFSVISERKKVIYIMNSEDKEKCAKIKKSCSNLPYLKVVNSKSIEINDLFYANEIILSKSCVEELNNRYSS